MIVETVNGKMRIYIGIDKGSNDAFIVTSEKLKERIKECYKDVDLAWQHFVSSGKIQTPWAWYYVIEE